jgi:hypothetical protein
MYYVRIKAKRSLVRTTESTLQFHSAPSNSTQNILHVHISENSLFRAAALQQRQNVDAAGCRTFLSGLINISVLIFCKFLPEASRFVVAALHTLTSPFLRT